ncbi:MAG: hypothetical protein UDO44_11175 [Prevotella sp.]|nr:hypothetical protein [Prevotella sp.]
MKYIEERIVKFLMLLSIGIVAFFVLSVLYTIFRRGLPVLSWEMVSQLPSGGFYLGGKGGFLNAIVGSLYIVGGSTLLGLIISLPVVFYMNVYLKPNSRFGYVARLAYDTLFGIPSIVYGSFAFTLMVYGWESGHRWAEVSSLPPFSSFRYSSVRWMKWRRRFRRRFSTHRIVWVPRG